MRLSPAPIGILLALFLARTAEAQDSPDAQTHRAVERSLPFLEKEGLGWIRKHDCLSCHHVPFLLWSHQEARARGIAVDEKKLAEWTDWSQKESMAQRVKLKLTEPALQDAALPAETLAKLAPLTKKAGLKEDAFLKELAKALSPEELAAHRAVLLKHAVREKGDGGGLDTMSQLLLAGGLDAAFAASTREKLAELQQADGSWKPGGQLPRMNRSEAEGTELTTRWTLLADPSKEGVERARAFLKNGKPGKTAEGLAVRLLTEKPASAEDIVRRQNPDGGWASLDAGTSDAFATGQILYALSAAGAPGVEAAVQKARKYLIDTQGADGSWAVAPLALTSPDTKPERLTRLEPIYRYWGTSWATIGLARTLTRP